MQLYHQAYTEHKDANDSPPVVIIPGLFGQGINWRSFAAKLSVNHPVYVIDQRNHGQSPRAESHTYMDMVDDLLVFIQQQGFDKVYLCGHSMGGKVAMLFALLYPSYVNKLVVLDIAPVAYKHSHAPFVREMLKINLASLTSRGEADRLLKPVITDTGTRMFLLQSLVGSPGRYHWRLNLATLLEYMPEIIDFPTHEVADLSSDIATLIMTGELSDYVLDEHLEVIKGYFPQMMTQSIANAGHWLHAEQPESVLNVLKSFLNRDK